jgi:hypothetical protein
LIQTLIIIGLSRKKEFHIKNSDSYNFPENGLKVGPAIYRTNNMTYGSSKPA